MFSPQASRNYYHIPERYKHRILMMVKRLSTKEQTNTIAVILRIRTKTLLKKANVVITGS